MSSNDERNINTFFTDNWVNWKEKKKKTGKVIRLGKGECAMSYSGL